jgi:hypothetical protein
MTSQVTFQLAVNQPNGGTHHVPIDIDRRATVQQLLDAVQQTMQNGVVIVSRTSRPGQTDCNQMEESTIVLQMPQLPETQEDVQNDDTDGERKRKIRKLKHDLEPESRERVIDLVNLQGEKNSNDHQHVKQRLSSCLRPNEEL